MRRFQACNFAGRRGTFRHFSLERVQKDWCTQDFAHVAISGVYGRRPFGFKAAFLAMEPDGWSTHWVGTDPVELAMERDWQANLAAEEAARQKSEDRTS